MKVEPKLETPVIPKIKYGDKEYTTDELTAKLAELEKKVATPEKKEEPVKAVETKIVETPKADPGAEKTPEQKDQEFITNRASSFKPEDYGISSDDLDTILSGGDEGVTQLTKTLGTAAARGELNARKWVEATLNPILAELSPVINQQREIAQYKAEESFFTARPELAPHRNIARSVSQALASKYPDRVASMSQDEFNTEVASHVEAIVKELGGAIQPVSRQEPVKAAPEVRQPVSRPKPPTGQLGGSGSPRAENPQRSMAQDLQNI